MKFRYISISFGAGRYRPHSAEEVLAISMAIAKTSTRCLRLF